MTSKDYVGRYATHKDFGRVLVTGRPKGARSIVNIRVVQRGPGWDEASETYKRVRNVRLNPDAGPGAKTISWDTVRRDEYGIEDEVHINDLTPIEE